MTNAGRPWSCSISDVEDDPLLLVPGGWLVITTFLSERLRKSRMISCCTHCTYGTSNLCNCAALWAFYKWLLQWVAAHLTFLSRVLLMDEVCLKWKQILNSHNQLKWGDENLHSFQGTQFKRQFATEVWVGIIGDLLPCTSELQPRLSRVSYLQFISEQLL
jgi:hypothetical protein